MSQQIETLIVLNDPSYVIQGWHGTLFSIAVTIFAIIWNTVLIRKLPLLEGIVLTLHVFGFFAFLVVLWVMGPRSPAKETFTDFQDNSGWANIGLSCLVSLLGPVLTLIGSDSSCHLSEELRDAAYILPRLVVYIVSLDTSPSFPYRLLRPIRCVSFVTGTFCETK